MRAGAGARLRALFGGRCAQQAVMKQVGEPWKADRLGDELVPRTLLCQLAGPGIIDWLLA